MARRSSRATKPTDPLARVDTLARNMWWTWNTSAKRLMESLDPALYHATNNNPIKTLRRLEPYRRAALAEDPAFDKRVASVEKDFASYLKTKTWFQRTASARDKRMTIAYFCMEYGLQESLPLYAGGLGVLAGDHLKSASDLGIPLVAIGVLWKKGYYRQEILPDGGVRVLYPEAVWDDMPFEDTGVVFKFPCGRKDLHVKIWKLDVGRTPLYLLDTDLKKNTPKDRELTHYLYAGGDPEYRVRQELLLGVGGLYALDALGIEPTVTHLNEGHAAFAGIERVRRLVTEQGYEYEEAVDQVASTSVFTTHTPVPEGNDRFEPNLVMKYIKPMTDQIGLNRKRTLALGREDVHDNDETFCMTVLALKTSDHCNGVAELHGDTARKMWVKTYGVKDPGEVPIGHVTNGVHPQTWISDDAADFYDVHLKPKWSGAGPEDDWWKGAGSIPPADIWALRNRLRRKLVTTLRSRMKEQLLYHEGGDADVIELYDRLDENALTIGFARRFALYKRAPLIFTDLKRLESLLANDKRPVQIIFAGKAHPMDDAGHEFVSRVWNMSQDPRFRGRIFLLQNYDLEIGRILTQGCDVWLNNPVRPMEASGTSGMKCPLNAGLNCSILDGWWPEGYKDRNGFKLGDGEQFKSRARQDRFDAEQIYSVLEKQVVPEFYKRARNGLPMDWIKRVKWAMRDHCCAFSSHRMLAEYLEDYYSPANANA
ncbi:MAG: alpha-glucan family phosphorylase [Planctomycetota bacterium]